MCTCAMCISNECVMTLCLCIYCYVFCHAIKFFTYNTRYALYTGPPDAVSDLRVESRGYHLMVTWQAPFSLDVTGVEYDITYSLLISNVTNETRPTAVSCAVCRNLTHPNFTFSPPHPLPGHTFTFTVTPQNGAGGGPQSHPVTATLTDGIIIQVLRVCEQSVFF